MRCECVSRIMVLLSESATAMFAFGNVCAIERGVNRPLVAIISYQGLSDRVRKHSVKYCILLVREAQE